MGITTTLLTELIDPKKSTHLYVSKVDGKYSYKNVTVEDMHATLEMRANNNPSEGKFATFTDMLCTCGQINLESAAGIGQMRYNNDMARDHHKLVTGRTSHCKD